MVRVDRLTTYWSVHVDDAVGSANAGFRVKSISLRSELQDVEIRSAMVTFVIGRIF